MVLLLSSFSHVKQNCEFRLSLGYERPISIAYPCWKKFTSMSTILYIYRERERSKLCKLCKYPTEEKIQEDGDHGLRSSLGFVLASNWELTHG